ncbi:hypothetical protein [Colwellia sp. UCD-KL20]|uniref:hypothetical protein n=1 Tax=Colwellia sp. UCD-KL20 TaxID=1917165 RepID=UPI0009708A31|nr:hypothetical protein [Colwellia sp. UCD-KL20]
MSKFNISENLTFDLKNKLNLKESSEIITNLINSILSNNPTLSLLLNKSKESFTEEDLKKILSYLASDKRLNKKVFKKAYTEKVRSIPHDHFIKAIAYEFILLSLYICLSLITASLRLTKFKKDLNKTLREEEKSKEKLFSKFNKKPSDKSKFKNNKPS